MATGPSPQRARYSRNPSSASSAQWMSSKARTSGACPAIASKYRRHDSKSAPRECDCVVADLQDGLKRTGDFRFLISQSQGGAAFMEPRTGDAGSIVVGHPNVGFHRLRVGDGPEACLSIGETAALTPLVGRSLAAKPRLQLSQESTLAHARATEKRYELWSTILRDDTHRLGEPSQLIVPADERPFDPGYWCPLGRGATAMARHATTGSPLPLSSNGGSSS